MILRIDPRYPLVWRTPSSVQIGISSPRYRLDHVSTETEHLLAALAIGVTRPGMSVIGKRAGVSERYVSQLLSSLEGVLEKRGETPPAPRIAVVGTGATASAIARLLVAHGAQIQGDIADSCDLVIVISDFVTAPEHFGTWLRRDIPHLPVILGDGEVVIGPMIEPGSGPCLYCLHCHATDADPAWPAIASQLVGKRSAADVPLVASEVAGIVARLTLARVTPGAAPALVHESRQLSIDSGILSIREWETHPRCGCIAVDSGAEAGATAESQRENDSADVVLSHGRLRSRHSRPTTATDVSVPA